MKKLIKEIKKDFNQELTNGILGAVDFDFDMMDKFIEKAVNKAYEAGKSEKFSSLSFLRQLFAELSPDHTFTAKQLHEAIESFHPLMTKEQEKQLVDNLRDIINNKIK